MGKAVLILLLHITVYGQPHAIGKNNDSVKMPARIFPIIANGVIRDNLEVDNIHYPRSKELQTHISFMADANFNVACVNFTPGNNDRKYHEYVGNIVRITKEKNLLLMIYDGRYYRGFPFFTPGEMVKSYLFPGIFGFFIDEPSLQDLPKAALWSTYFNHLSQTAIEDRAIPLLYVNLFGIHAIRKYSYEEYLTTWIQTGKPRVLSFDNYSFWDDERAKMSDAMLGADITKDYFINLQIFSDLSVKYLLPFWTWIQVHRHSSEYSKRFYRRASSADLRFQVYCAIAYGVKGLLYYNYWNPPQASNNQWNEEHGLIGYDGKPTELFHEAKRINGIVQSIGEILLDLECDGVYHSTNWVWIPNKNDYQRDWDPMYDRNDTSIVSKNGIKLSSWNTERELPSSVLSRKIIYTIGNVNGMIGQLRNRKTDETLVMVVNKNRHSRQKIDFDIFVDGKTTSRHATLFNVVENKEYIGAYKINPNRLTFTCDLDAGEGSLFRIQN